MSVIFKLEKRGTNQNEATNMYGERNNKIYRKKRRGKKSLNLNTSTFEVA